MKSANPLRNFKVEISRKNGFLKKNMFNKFSSLLYWPRSLKKKYFFSKKTSKKINVIL